MFNKKNYVLELDTNLWTQIPISRQGNHKIIRHYILYSANKPEKSIRNKKINKLKNDYSEIKIKNKLNNNINKKELVEVNKKVKDITNDIYKKPSINSDLDIELLHYSFHEPKVENYSKDFINNKINLPSTSELRDNLHYDEFNELNLDAQNNLEKSEIEKYKKEIEEINILENISTEDNNKNYKLNLPNSKTKNSIPKKTNFSENNIFEEKENELLNLPTAWRITSLPSAKTLFEEETQIQKDSKNENYITENIIPFENKTNLKKETKSEVLNQTDDNSNKEFYKEIFESKIENNQKINNQILNYEKINTTFNEIQLIGLPKAEIKIKDKQIEKSIDKSLDKTIDKNIDKQIENQIENFKTDLDKDLFSVKLPKAVKIKNIINQELDNLTKIESFEKEKINLPKSRIIIKENKILPIQPAHIVELQELSELRQNKEISSTPPPKTDFQKTSELRQIEESLPTSPPETDFDKTSELRQIEESLTTPPPETDFHKTSELRQIEESLPTPPSKIDYRKTSELRQTEAPPLPPLPISEKKLSTPPSETKHAKTSELRQIEKNSSTPPLPETDFHKTSELRQIKESSSTLPSDTDFENMSELRQVKESSSTPQPEVDFQKMSELRQIEKNSSTPPLPETDFHKTSELRQIKESSSTPPSDTDFENMSELRQVKESLSTPPPKIDFQKTSELQQIEESLPTPPSKTDFQKTSELQQIEESLPTPPSKTDYDKTSELQQIKENLPTPPPHTLSEKMLSAPPNIEKKISTLLLFEIKGKKDYEIFTDKIKDEKNNQLEKTRSKIFNKELEELTKDIVNFPNKKNKEVSLIDSKNTNQENKTYLEKISSSYIKLKTSDNKINKFLNETSNNENSEKEVQNNFELNLKNQNIKFLENNTKIIKDEFSTKDVGLEYKNPYVYEEKVSEYLTKLYKKPIIVSNDFDILFEELLKIYQLETKTLIDGLAILSYNETDNTFKIFLDYNINNKELSNNICFVDNQKIFFPEKFIQELDLVELNKNNNFKKIITLDIINLYKKIFIQKIFLETKNEDEYPLYLLLFYKQNNRFANFTKNGFNDFNPKNKIIIKNLFKDFKIPLLQYRFEIWNKKYSQNSFSILTNNIFQNFSKFAGKGKEPFTCLYFKIESSSSFLKTYNWKIILDNFSQKISEKISDNEKIFILSTNKILLILNKSNPKIIVNVAQEFCTQNKFELIHYSKEFPKQGINFFNYLD